MSNPYLSPQNQGYQPGPPSQPAGHPNQAKQRLRGPAISLMVCSGFSIMVFLGFLLFYLVLIVTGNAGMEDYVMRSTGEVIDGEVVIAIRSVFAIILILFHGTVFYGGMCMSSLKNYGLARTASIISVIPCCSPCYLLGIPFGIWGLVVLNDPQIKKAFRT